MVKAAKSAITAVSTMVGGGDAIGPYSCGKIIRNDQGAWGYSSGQIGKSPKTGKLVGTKPA